MILPLSHFAARTLQLIARRTNRVNRNLPVRPAHLPDIPRQRIDPCRIGIPGEHETRAAADERIKLPAALAQRLQVVGGGAQEDRVGLDRKHQLEIRQIGHRGSEPRGAGVGMLRIAQPRAVLQHADPGRRQKTHF